MKSRISPVIFFYCIIVGLSCTVLAPVAGALHAQTQQTLDLEKRLVAYAPVEIDVPWNLISDEDRPVLENLYYAARIMDELFLRQVCGKNVEMRRQIMERGDPAEIQFFRINFGPWDRLASDEPVLTDRPKPPGATFYPADMTREEFGAWIAAHPGDREGFEGTFTVIRRDGAGGMKAVPYSDEHRELLAKAVDHLRKAAALTKNESLARFLETRADAFFSNDYFESDMAWMDVAGNVIDVTIGPYEVYEDNLFNYKAAFEAFVCVRDPAESTKLDGLKAYVVKMEKNLPIEDRYKNLDRGLESPISVVDLIFSAGDTKAGVQTLAFNLPNDERVQAAKGSKKVMLRNICHAKFDKILMPIAERLIAKEQLPRVTFDAYFNHILLHEFSHGLGPGFITLEDGTETTAQKALREAHSAIEEAKADVVGQYNLYYLIDDGFFPRRLTEETAVTYLAGFFRSVRFGIDSAHGRANMLAFNYFKEKGAYVQDQATGAWSVDPDRIRDAVKALSRDILMLQARGDYDGAKKFMEKYGTMGDDVKASLSKLEGIPVDIEPQFAIEKEYAGR
ncbi:MAG TPA: peptidase [Patescibacteria group bacterium]|nr:peptidase [Patescibacteria group bacterium]